MLTVENRLGKIVFSKQSLKQIVKDAVTNCYGVSSLAPKQSKFNAFKNVIGLENNDGIVIKKSRFTIKVDIRLKLSYGLNVSQIIKSIKNKVGWSIKDVTGVFADEINVIVDNVNEL